MNVYDFGTNFLPLKEYDASLGLTALTLAYTAPPPPMLPQAGSVTDLLPFGTPEEYASTPVVDNWTDNPDPLLEAQNLPFGYGTEYYEPPPAPVSPWNDEAASNVTSWAGEMGASGGYDAWSEDPYEQPEPEPFPTYEPLETYDWSKYAAAAGVGAGPQTAPAMYQQSKYEQGPWDHIDAPARTATDQWAQEMNPGTHGAMEYYEDGSSAYRPSLIPDYAIDPMADQTGTYDWARAGWQADREFMASQLTQHLPERGQEWVDYINNQRPYTDEARRVLGGLDYTVLPYEEGQAGGGGGGWSPGRQHIGLGSPSEEGLIHEQGHAYFDLGLNPDGSHFATEENPEYPALRDRVLLRRPLREWPRRLEGDARRPQLQRDVRLALERRAR